MFHIRMTRLGREIPLLSSSFPQLIVAAHTKTCPTNAKKKSPCPPAGKPPKPPKCPDSPGGKGSKTALVRASKSGKVRMGFIPDEWFLFFYPKTGVTGSYLFGIVLANYLVSKEKYILEHEYYIGLSFVVVLYYVSTTFGPMLGAALDKEVDLVAAAFEKTRTDEMDFFKNTIKQAKDSQWRAEGQKLLMDAKKENVIMQLEAIFRERQMLVYRMVKGRMDYHVKLHRAQARIQQKWMLGWILSRVMKSITPELEQQALSRAIEDLTAAAGRAK